MTYPKLVPDFMCKTKVDLILYEEGLTEDGQPITVELRDKKCNFQDGANTVLTAEKKLIQLSGVALFNGDIAPQMSVISGGKLIVFDEERDIYKGTKSRNPDGTVNFTKIELK